MKNKKRRGDGKLYLASHCFKDKEMNEKIQIILISDNGRIYSFGRGYNPKNDACIAEMVAVGLVQDRVYQSFTTVESDDPEFLLAVGNIKDKIMRSIIATILASSSKE